MTQQSNKPVHQIRLGGLKAAIWRVDTGEAVRHNVSFSRSYPHEGE